MRVAMLSVISVALAAAPAAADRFGPAADLTTAMTGATGDLSVDGSPYIRFGAGVQYGRAALLLQVDATSLTPPDPSLDSSGLTVYGKGAGLRVELVQRRGMYLHLTAGYTLRHQAGQEEVRRGCSTFGGCDAGFFQEVPDYHDGAPWLSIGFGGRGKRSIWPGLGAELGLAPMTIDRSGVAPDAHGVVVWFGVNATLGAN